MDAILLVNFGTAFGFGTITDYHHMSLDLDLDDGIWIACKKLDVDLSS